MAKIVNLKGMRATYPPIHLCICLINLKKNQQQCEFQGYFWSCTQGMHSRQKTVMFVFISFYSVVQLSLQMLFLCLNLLQFLQATFAAKACCKDFELCWLHSLNTIHLLVSLPGQWKLEPDIKSKLDAKNFSNSGLQSSQNNCCLLHSLQCPKTPYTCLTLSPMSQTFNI